MPDRWDTRTRLPDTGRMAMGQFNPDNNASLYRTIRPRRLSNLGCLGFVFILTCLTVHSANGVCGLKLRRLLAVEMVEARVRTNVLRNVQLEGAPRLAYLAPHRFAFQLRQTTQADRIGTRYDDGWRESAADESGWAWRLDVEWDFAKLIYNPATVAQQRMQLEIERRREHAVDLAVRLYYELLERMRQVHKVDDSECEALSLQIQKLTARLNVLIGATDKKHRIVELEGLGPYTKPDATNRTNASGKTFESKHTAPSLQ